MMSEGSEPLPMLPMPPIHWYGGSTSHLFGPATSDMHVGSSSHVRCSIVAW